MPAQVRLLSTWPIWRKDISLIVGNDIVDLHAAEAEGKSRDLRFIDKVLTDAERLGFGHAVFQDKYLWAVWAAKETAYKSVVKDNPGVASWPKRYEVVFDPCFSYPFCSATVNAPFASVGVILYINENYIHCIGSSSAGVCPDTLIRGVEKMNLKVCSSIGNDPKLESKTARQAAVRRISEYLDLPSGEIEIRRNIKRSRSGPPVVYIRGNPSDIDLSLSHHGRFAAFAFREAVENEKDIDSCVNSEEV